MNSTFVSLDIETTGLDPETCQIIEVGAVIDDWLNPLEDPPTFHRYVTHKVYRGEPYALSMHRKIFRRIADKEEGFDYIGGCWLAVDFDNWLKRNDLPNKRDKINVAGKNFAGFDTRFLSKINDWNRLIKFHHRVLDPAMLCWNPLEDSVLPDSKTCKDRCDLKGEVAHTALEDAFDVAHMIQHRVKNWQIVIGSADEQAELQV